MGLLNKVELLHEILGLEEACANSRVDNFDVGRRKLNSRQKHLGCKRLSEADEAKLTEYKEHLLGKLGGLT